MSPTPAAINGVKKNGVNGTQPLTLSNDNSADLHLLTHAEQQLCQSLKIKAKPYMCIKERLITEAIKHGGILKEKAARDICRLQDTQKALKIHDFFARSGWIGKA